MNYFPGCHSADLNASCGLLVLMKYEGNGKARETRIHTTRECRGQIRPFTAPQRRETMRCCYLEDLPCLLTVREGR